MMSRLQNLPQIAYALQDSLGGAVGPEAQSTLSTADQTAQAGRRGDPRVSRHADSAQLLLRPGGSGGPSFRSFFRAAARQLPAAGGRASRNDLLRGRSAGCGVRMEGSASGRARRAWRRARAAVVLLLSALVVRAPPSVGYLVRLPRGFSLTQDLVKIVGSPDFPVKVYVMLHQKSPHLLCVTQRLRNSELIDPSFQWHGPRGKIISENSSAQVTTTGSLIFQNFEENMSGVYTCFLEYKPMVEEEVKNLQLKYVVYAYREPRYFYQFTARYHAAPCNSIYNISFEKKLLQILSKLVLDLSCEVSLLKSECHHVKMQKAGLQNELFFTFSVSSIEPEKGPKPCADHNCESSRRLAKAKNLIERFFNQQVEVLGRSAQPLPEIYYIEGTLQMIWINRCFPGYGMNSLKHPKCPECCVICSPGSYNPRDGIHCLQCNSSLVYGAKACL
ncbi:LOW QUALITY PROTEIN: zona pellucida-binding protein 1 [Diceros bicornis minor]|uniref:LOW QUALITY PROTEIN: zona pellucida-binding protein 1 n=1 Tax=Diceros bicornis minor TaxID=77932 RepID=UPI0026EE0C40|nr:LOW QUALITY PROTEIN: zona pellucida-binding protein 1 [Diceros bicornis minor]